jgi:hypothetical protein
VLAGALGTAVAAVGVPVTRRLTRDPDPGGMLVPELLTAPGFTVAHRGGSADWPEMSMDAYRRSVRLGVDALEMSVARSADGVWFGLHDATLDRTSGTTGFAAADHPWSEIRTHRIRPTGTYDTSSADQPYLPLADLAAAYAGTHAIFVDPKLAAPEHYPELLALMDAAGPAATGSFVAKAYCTTTGWAAAARARGYRTWGYYYGRELADGSTPPAATQAGWDLLGLDVAAPATAWSTMLGFGKPVIAHIVASPADAAIARDRGARGQMISAPRELLTG